MTESSTDDMQIETVQERLEELFDRDTVMDHSTNDNRPYDVTITRVQIHGRGHFYLDHDEVVALRVLPVRTHSVKDSTLRLEFVGENSDDEQEQEED